MRGAKCDVCTLINRFAGSFQGHFDQGAFNQRFAQQLL